MGENDLVLDARLGSQPPLDVTFIKYKNWERKEYNVDLAHLSDPGTPQSRTGDQQSDIHRQIAIQYAYLTAAAENALGRNTMMADYPKADDFAARLQTISHNAITRYVRSQNLVVGRVLPARLEAVGSLASGFALPDSNLDLILLPRKQYPRYLEDAYPRLLEKTLLDLGFGARFLPNERTPMLQVCEKPSPEILRSLRGERNKWERGQPMTTKNGKFRGVDFPKSGVGMQSQITFSDPLAIHMRSMLRCYKKCDHRVEKLVLFVKRWAKNRGINDPSRGTLSSHGYLFMVLHYLMNVCNPAVIPNLQHDATHSTTIVQGHKVGFHNDMEEIASRVKRGKMSKNTECIASLIQGFFQYYASQGGYSPEGGFNWHNSTISIRTKGGLMSKREKGWTRSRMENGFRNYYLLAIEDPFNIALNHGQTVDKSGLERIRGEILRANTIIRRMQYIPGAGLMWRNDKGLVGEDLLAGPEVRPYQEIMPIDEPHKPSVATITLGEKACSTHAKPAEEPTKELAKETTKEPVNESQQQQEPRPALKRGLKALLDSMTPRNPPPQSAKKQEQLRKKNAQQFARGAQELRRIMGLDNEVTKREASGKMPMGGSGDAGLDGGNHVVVEQQESNGDQKACGDGNEKKDGDSDMEIPSVSPYSGRDNVDGDEDVDWDSVESVCSSQTGSNAELMAALPFEGIPISFKKN